MNGEQIWRQRLWVWLPAAVFFLANVAAFGVYRLGYAGDVQSLERSFDERRGELRDVEGRRRELERLIGGARQNRQRITQLYEERFSTRRRRLTGITAEVKKLATQAGLSPRDLTYPEETIEDHGLVERSFIFGVEGTYLELRKFLNLLELTDSFLTLEEINLTGGSGGPELHINLSLSTLFSREEAPQEGAPRVVS